MVKRFGGSKVLVHYGGGSVVRSGLLDRVKASLEKEGLPFVGLGGVMPNPRSGLVYEGIELCRKESIVEELGAKEEDIPKLVDMLCDGDGRSGYIEGFVKLDKEACTKIYQAMC